MYLKKEIDKLVDFYPNSFNSKNIILLKKWKIMKIKLITKIYLTNSFLLKKILLDYMISNFLKKYGNLYNLLNHLLTNKISTNDANVDQIRLFIN